MKKNRFILLAGLVVFAAAGMTFAQRGGFGGPGGPGGGFGPPPSPLAEAIDADGDGEITMGELSKAKEIFAKLDADKDGKLGEEELRPQFGGRGGRGFGGPPGRGFGDRGGRDRGGREVGGREGGGDATAIVERYMSLDKNNDGRVTQDEAGPRLEGLMARADADKDGSVTKEEFTKLASAESRGGARRNRGGRDGDRPGGFGDREGRGGPGGGFGGPGGGFGGPGGPPSPEQFVARAMEFDANKDGQLNKEELGKMAEEMSSRRQRGFGDHDHDQERRGNRRGPRDRAGQGSDRPQRPTRPE